MYFHFTCSLTDQIVALKEIRIQPEEGVPFTAIREGKCLCAILLIQGVEIFTCTGISLKKVNATLYFILENYDELTGCVEKVWILDLHCFNRGYIWFHTVFKRVYTCMLFKHI